MFRHACKKRLEGIVSKRLGSRYVSGRTRNWLLKFRNPDAPAIQAARVRNAYGEAVVASSGVSLER
jgi:hypothetical protein